LFRENIAIGESFPAAAGVEQLAAHASPQSKTSMCVFCTFVPQLLGGEMHDAEG
jgi:hypothetical protein